MYQYTRKNQSRTGNCMSRRFFSFQNNLLSKYTTIILYTCTRLHVEKKKTYILVINTIKNVFFKMKMVILFTKTSHSTITLSPTSLLNRAYHTRQSSPFPEPLPLSRSRNITWQFREWNNNLQRQIITLSFIGNSLSPVESKTKADTIHRHH